MVKVIFERVLRVRKHWLNDDVGVHSREKERQVQKRGAVMGPGLGIQGLRCDFLGV